MTSDLILPPIGYGTRIQRDDACRDLVEAALAEGYRHIDTAPSYGNEEAVGAGIRRSSVPRDEILLATKISPEDLAPDRVRAAVEASLARLGVDHVDLLLIHWPSRTVPVEDTLAVLATLRDEGLTGWLGVANFPTALLAAAAEATELVTNQVEYHPYLAQDAVLAAVRSRGLVLTAYCPLGRGGEVLADERLRDIAAAHGRSVPQVILRWLVQQDGVVAIPGTSSHSHLRENLRVHDFSLDDDEMRTIHALARGDRVVDPPARAPVWD